MRRIVSAAVAVFAGAIALEVVHALVMRSLPAILAIAIVFAMLENAVRRPR